MLLQMLKTNSTMFVIKSNNEITSETLIQLTSISGGRFEPPTVFAVRLDVYYSILVEFCQICVFRLTNAARRGIIKITRGALL